MSGKIRRKLLAERLDALPVHEPASLPDCPLCGRPIPAAQQESHHLVPKSRGGRETEFMHRICHRQIHVLFTDAELARDYSTVEALLTHPEVSRFVAWVRTRPDDFHERARKSTRRR